MSFDPEPRDLTRAEVRALMPGDLRDILLSAFHATDTCLEYGWDGMTPMVFQHVRTSPTQSPEDLGHPIVIAGLEDEPPARVLTIAAEALEEAPERWADLVPGFEDPRFLGISILYPGSLTVDNTLGSRYVKGVTDGGVGFVVSQEPGNGPRARIAIPTPHDGDPLDADELHVALRRMDAIFRSAYQVAEAVGGLHADEPPLPLPEGCLTEEELRAMPASLLRDVALDAMDVERHHHEAIGWTDVGAVAFRHRLHGGDEADGEGEHMCPQVVALADEGETPERLDRLAGMLAHDEDLRRDLDLVAGSYCATSVLDHCWYYAGRADSPDLPAEGRDLADVPGSRRMRFVLGVARDGSAFMVRRVQGQPPVVELADNLDAAIGSLDAYGGEIGSDMVSLRRINAEFTRLDVAPETDNPPTATLADLPPEKRFPSTDMVMLVVRWGPGLPREGEIYPALPRDHEYAARPCPDCELALADGLPVQTFAIGPTDPEGRAAYHAGLPHDAVAALTHQRCIPTIAARFGNVLSRVRSVIP